MIIFINLINLSIFNDLKDSFTERKELLWRMRRVDDALFKPFITPNIKRTFISLFHRKCKLICKFIAYDYVWKGKIRWKFGCCYKLEKEFKWFLHESFVIARHLIIWSAILSLASSEVNLKALTVYICQGQLLNECRCPKLYIHWRSLICI